MPGHVKIWTPKKNTIPETEVRATTVLTGERNHHREEPMSGPTPTGDATTARERHE
jgi:hypothetical protein